MEIMEFEQQRLEEEEEEEEEEEQLANACTVKQQADLCSVVSRHTSQLKQALSCTNARPNNEDDSTESHKLEQKDNNISKGKGFKHKQVPRNMGGMDQPLTPVLVVDTFFDKMLGHGVDGIDIADLNKVKKAKACDRDGGNLRIILNDEEDARASTVTRNYVEEMDKLHSGQIILSGSKCNFPMVDRIPKGSPIFGENGCIPATSSAENRNSYERGFVSKLRFRLPSNKTIFDVNLHNFGEKLWRSPDVDISEFFNYGLDEKKWKDYCKLIMEAKARAGGSGQSTLTSDESRQSHKEVKPNMGINECLPLMNPKDLSFRDSNVIIEIVRRDCLYENEQIRKDDAEGPDGGNAHLLNRRMINGEKILPFPMDAYSRDHREKRKQRQKNNYNMNIHGEALGQNTLACRKRKHKYQSSYGKEMVHLMGSNEMDSSNILSESKENIP